MRRPGIRRSVAGAAVSVLLTGAGCAKTVLAPEDYASRPPMRAPAPADPGEASRNATAARLATRYLGAPYVRAGSSPAGFDCSGLVRHVYASVGVALPHNAAQQYRYGTPVERDGLAPGDLVFFDRLRHNGIYLGDGRFVHATRPGGVVIARLDNGWFRARWVGARRL
jgi:cell wall-associated NlpC family hydrolase